ncbi:DMT family transporter [Pseudaestuariivita sp.]|uniref:DMT family transporter n=1 Tax=Pseudaestuariivita sp. TaxID=2211669 RepID=UPI00405A390C
MQDALPRANPALAAALTVLASALVAGTTLLAKALGQDSLGPALHPFQITFGRFAFALIALLCAAAVVRARLMPTNLPMHGLRVALGFTGVTLMFAAAARIPLADATAISFLNPVFGMIAAVLFLRETSGPWRWGAACVALIGAMILLRPTGAAVELGALLALGAAVALGLELAVIKTLSRSNGAFQVLIASNTIGTAFAVIAVLGVWSAPTPAQWAALAGIGALMISAQACFINAVMRADASFTAPFWYATLIFAALYDLVIFGVRPDAVSLIGITVILAGGLTLAWREGRAARTL